MYVQCLDDHTKLTGNPKKAKKKAKKLAAKQGDLAGYYKF